MVSDEHALTASTGCVLQLRPLQFAVLQKFVGENILSDFQSPVHQKCWFWVLRGYSPYLPSWSWQWLQERDRPTTQPILSLSLYTKIPEVLNPDAKCKIYKNSSPANCVHHLMHCHRLALNNFNHVLSSRLLPSIWKAYGIPIMEQKQVTVRGLLEWKKFLRRYR